MNKWVIANGNWNTPEIWNDGEIPQEGDTVYLNGKTVTYTTNINLGNGIITNSVTPETGIGGGHLADGNTSSDTILIVTANLHAENTEVLYQSSSSQTTVTYIVGDITTLNAYAVRKVREYSKLTVNGNVNGQLYYCPLPYNDNVIINGNVIQEENHALINYAGSRYTFGSLTINGLYKLNYYPLTTNAADRWAGAFTVNGELNVSQYNNTPLILNKNIVINGKLNILANNNIIPSSVGVTTQTQIEITSGADYPNEGDVKKDVSYDYGQMVGTLESVTVTNTNTINVYPYKRRCN